ncbi:hypothetical protein OG568_05300 [Streptomyces sp. NBC_01450]|uniref:hypothetical protein n=1 Tax=Streptomyces sp. NBC_01450 TaxID=2903871 RepID=UPI002E2F109D|nr:hypothetical protein [Streptomyces sp. NBC_01450]
MSKSTAEALEDLARYSNVAVHSTSAVAGDVGAAASEDDEERKEKDLEALRRKPGLRPLRAADLDGSVRLTPWDVLHTLARAISLARRGAARGLAEHWGSLKYSLALNGSPTSFMGLSAEGRDTADYYKALQSGELGIGFALAVAERILSRRYPDHAISIVPADTALRAGWALNSKDKGTTVGYRYRPQYFGEVWKPGEPSRIFPVVSRGNHGTATTSYSQLADASAYIEGVHIGTYDETPGLIFSTQLPLDEPLTVHALKAEGSDGWLSGTDTSPLGNLNAQLQDEAWPPGIHPPADNSKGPSAEPGIHVTEEITGWFQRVLARTSAAGLTAFAGDGNSTAPYLTTRQGSRRFSAGIAHAATSSVRDAKYTLLGIPFIGTDHVFRLNGTRVEAFSGVHADLFGHLSHGHLEQYRSDVYALRSTWPSDTWDRKWDGPVSIHQDGSVLAIHLLP